MKICKRCSIELDLSKFGKNKNNKDGFSIYCLDCETKRGKEYREKNREKVNNGAKKWRKENPENYKNTIKKYLEKNPHMTSKERSKRKRENLEYRKKQNVRLKEYRIKNIEKIRKKTKEYYYKNKEKVRKKSDEWKKNKMKTDGFFRLKKNLRDRIRNLMIGKNIGKRTKEILGLDYVEFKEYISNKFIEGMSWENYGEWHLDHIIPLCEAKTEEEVIKLNHYTNLQPLWAKDNLKKNRKYGS